MPRRPKDSPPPRDPKQIIDDQAHQIERLREDLVRSENERNRLRREIERLREELEMARRRANRQAAPCSRGLPKANPEPPGRKAGAGYGRTAHRPRPRQIDATHDAPLPAQCPDCGGPVRLQPVVSQYQEDLPVERPVVHGNFVWRSASVDTVTGACRGGICSRPPMPSAPPPCSWARRPSRSR